MATKTVITEFRWKIEDFKQRVLDVSSGTCIYSDIFPLSGNSGAKFQLEYYRGEAFHWPSLICKDLGENEQIKFNYNFWLRTRDKSSKNYVRDAVFRDIGDDCDAFCRQYKLLESFIENDALLICVQIKHEVPVEKLDETDPEIDSEIDVNDACKQFCENMRTLYSDGVSDLTIQVDGQEFKAMKYLLMSRSQVFKTMFSMPNSIEAQTNIIKIEDFNSATVEALIHWMHFLKLDNLGALALDLFKAAHRYDIDPLMKECIQSMKSGLSLENLPSYLLLAYNYDEEDFKHFILRFIRKDSKNMHYLIASDEWAEVNFNNRDLAKKILADIYQHS